MQHRVMEINTLREEAREKYSVLPTCWPATKRQDEHVLDSPTTGVYTCETEFCAT